MMILMELNECGQELQMISIELKTAVIYMYECFMAFRQACSRDLLKKRDGKKYSPPDTSL